MIEAAIAGIGWWGQKIVNAVQGRSTKMRFIRAVSKEPGEAQPFADKHGMALSTDLADVLADPKVQAVVLATPHSLHTSQIMQVAASGRAVFCEKPLALKRADAEQSIAACRAHNVVLGLGTNKRFWPSNRELRKVYESGVLGELLHVEGHYTNENSGAHHSEWRTLKSEAPGAGMTGAGIHVIDALTSFAGPLAEAYAQVMTRKPQPDPLDSVTAVLRYANGVSGSLGTVRSSTFYWRIHLFGTNGSAEAVGEDELVLRLKGRPVERRQFEKVDSLRAEFEAFADAVAGVAPFPVPHDEMANTVGAFETIVRSIETGRAAVA